MRRKQVLRWLSAAMTAVTIIGANAARAQDLLRPPEEKLFVRAEDRQRARLSRQPCEPADVGRGCYRSGEALNRKPPCLEYENGALRRSIPFDQCYRMMTPSYYRGVWIDAFEGQTFTPERPKRIDGASTPAAIGSRNERDRTQETHSWIDTSRVSIEHKSKIVGQRRFIEFIGRQTMYPGGYGHMGLSTSYIIVDRLVSIRDCPDTAECR